MRFSRTPRTPTQLAEPSGTRRGATRLGLQSRLLTITALVVGTCLGGVGWVLDRAFNAAVLAGAEEQLRAVAYGLLSAAEEGEGDLAFATELGEPRLSQPDSGLYAYVQDANGRVIWRSPSIIASGSAIAAQPVLVKRPAPGESFFGTAEATGDTARFAMAYTVIWEAVGSIEMTFWVLADQFPYRRQITEFRRSIALGLASAAAAFVLIELAALRWGLAPVRRMAGRIRRLEAGSRPDIGDDYPRELSGLARNLNRFIHNEKANRERYRRAMDDLAHSLKTPLAVLKNALGERQSANRDMMRDQVERMETTVAHQLSRAAAVHAAIPVDSIAVMPASARIAKALKRVYAEKDLVVELAHSDLAVRVDERDLLEMLGNLIENAFKYTHKRVRICAHEAPPAADGNEAVAITVEDDGDGIPPGKRHLVMQRGVRADTATAGQGIGLAVALDLALLYGGRLEIDDSDLGGAALRLALPRGR